MADKHQAENETPSHTPDRRRHDADDYNGPERRAHKARQRNLIKKEKLAFLNATTVSVGLLTAAALYAAVFLLAPELKTANENAARVEAMQDRIDALNKQISASNAAILARRKQQQEAEYNSLGGKLSRQLGNLEDAADVTAEVAGRVKDAAIAAAIKAAPIAGVDDLLILLTGMQKLARTEDGRLALARSVSLLRGAVAASGSDTDGINAAVSLARRQDATLAALFSHVKEDHLAAATLLLSLDDLRRRIARQESYADALYLAATLVGQDPVVKGALLRLAPYADTGISGRGALQQQLAALAADIVIAEMKEQNNGAESGSLKDQALQRLSEFVTIRKQGDPEGTDAAAAVTRAQGVLATGDVRSALAEMQSLQGSSAVAAAPWVVAANGYVAAEDSANVLSQTVFQILSSTAESGSFDLPGIINILKTNVAPPELLNLDSGAPAVPYLSPALTGGENAGGFGGVNLKPYE